MANPDPRSTEGRRPSPTSQNQVQLEPFVHQVGGHFPMVCLDASIVCKPLNEREHRFYLSVPYMLRAIIPGFEGTMEIEASEDEDGYITLRGNPPPEYIQKQRRRNRLSQIRRSDRIGGESKDSGPAKDPPHYRLKRKESLEIEPALSHEEESELDESGLRRKSSSECSSQGPESSGTVCTTQEEAFCNPWALKCHRDHLKKLGILKSSQSEDPEGQAGREHTSSEDISTASSSSSAFVASKASKKTSRSNPQLYLLLENLVSRYRHPCVLDLKIGTRQYADDVSAAKKQRKIAKAENSTSSTLGLRLCGMQVYKAKNGRYVCHNKYFGRTLNNQGLKSTIEEFLINEETVRIDIVDRLLDKLERMRKIVTSLESFRFYTSSLLITYDGYGLNKIDLRIIDFAHSTHKDFDDAVIHKGPDDGFLFGLNNFLGILNEIRKKAVI